MIRLGGPVLEPITDPDDWVTALKRLGYTTSYCPVGPDAPIDLVADYREAAKRAGIFISEVGAWSNPISRDPSQIGPRDPAIFRQQAASISSASARQVLHLIIG